MSVGSGLLSLHQASLGEAGASGKPQPGSISPSGGQQTHSDCDSLHKTDISQAKRAITPYSTITEMLVLVALVEMLQINIELS